MKLGIKPAGYRLIVRPDKIKEMSEGGIYLKPDEKLEKAAQIKGTLISVGDQAWKDMVDGTPWAKAGDKILYARYAGKNITDPLTGEDFLIINDKDLVAVIIEEESNE